MNPRIFREYDIRGVADRDLPDGLVRDIGRALGTYIKRHGEAHPDAPRIVLGRDCRLHSERLRDAMLLGLRDTGVSVIDIGQVPSPLLYFAAHQLKTAGGVQVTGSHNPPSDNGFKLLRGSRHLAAAELHILRALIEAQDFERGEGSVHSLDLSTEYQLFIRERTTLGPRRFRVVVDGGNGVGGELLVSLLRSLGFDVVPLYCEPDGRFPNHLPDPTVPEHLIDLQRAVAEHDAELGLALDGDADRLAAVDRQGRVLWGDQLMILFARAILAEQPGASFVCEVKCSKALLDEIAARGGQAVVWRVGRTLIHEKMRETGAALGGEMSGHLFFAHRYLGFDDAIYAAARLCELLSQSAETLAQMVDTLPRLHNTPELRLVVPEERKFDIASAVAAELRTLPGVGAYTAAAIAAIAFDQPLAGEVAARRELLESIPFSCGYGVEIAMLIEVWDQVGIEGMAQVELGTKRNAHQSLAALSGMSSEVIAAMAETLDRLGREDTGRLAMVESTGPEVVMRPAFATLPGTKDGPAKGDAGFVP